MNQMLSALVTYPAPDGAALNDDFAVRVRTVDREYQDLCTYLVRVDMHDVREASMATFDFAGIVEVEITYRRGASSSGSQAYSQSHPIQSRCQ